MRTAQVFSALALMAATAHASAQPDRDTTSAPPPVVRALIFPDAAQLTRVAEAPCGAEPTSALFGNLPPVLDPATVRATILGGGRVEGVSLVERVRRESYGEEVRKLDEQIRKLEARQQQLTRKKQRAQADRDRAASLRQTTVPFIAREAAAQAKPNVDAWNSALEQARVAIEQADKEKREAEIAQREVQRQIEDLQNQRERLEGAQPTRAYDAEVVVRCSGDKAKVELSYLTPAASWSPVYEARADENAGAVNLSVLAEVKQRTGEAWRNVEVTLSTALSRRDARPPKPQRLYVGSTNEEDKKRVLVKREEQSQHVDSVQPSQPPQAGEGLDAADQGLSVQLKVPGKAELAGDGRPARLLVQTVPLKARFSFQSVPKVLPVVFRAAEAVNSAKFPFLAGPVDLFSDGSFLGNARLQRTAENDKLELAFGLADTVKVRRIVVGEEKKDPGVFGSTRKLTYAYRIELKSFEKQPTTVTLKEHVPVAEIDDVKVSFDEGTTPGYELQKDDGLVSWKVALQPGETKYVDLRFSVEIPSKYDSSGL